MNDFMDRTRPRWQRNYDRWEIRVSTPQTAWPVRGGRNAMLCDARRAGTSSYIVANAFGASLLGALISLKATAAGVTRRQDGAPFVPEERAAAVLSVERAIGDYLGSCNPDL